VRGAATQSTNALADAHTVMKQFSASVASELEPQQADNPPKLKKLPVDCEVKNET